MENESNKTKLDVLARLVNNADNNTDVLHNPIQHDQESRLKITKLFLTWYFALISGGFIFALIYNCIMAYLNFKLGLQKENSIKYIDVINTVSLVTTTLSSGVGFVIGYYFKNKND